MVKHEHMYVLRKWGKWWWVIPFWAGMAVLSFLFTTFCFAALNTQAVSSPQFTDGGYWPTYLGDVGRSGYNQSEHRINLTSAPHLKLHWLYHAGGNISTQPVVVNGMIYWGSWDGYEHATRLDGTQVWQTNLGQTSDTACHPPVAGVASISTVTSVVINGKKVLVDFVGGGNAYFYALNATTGTVLWRTKLGTPPATFLWGSPGVYKGSVYMGVSSFGDCPLIQGRLVKMDLATGAIQHVFNNVPNGCIGGAVWSSPTFDPAGNVYIATGTIHPTCPTPEPHALSMIELRAADLSFVSSWQLPPSDWIGDSTDFGATPTIFQANIGGKLRLLVGANNKNGKFYAFERGAIDKGPVWEDQIAAPGNCPLCGEGAISSSAWDGAKLYIAGGHVTINGTSCLGSIQAVNPATGARLWRRCLKDGAVLAPVTLIPGLVIVPAGPDVLVIAAATGKTITTLTDTHGNSRYFAGASVSNGVLYAGNMDGNLYAYGL
jgi:outer membrane protein assembly factor BamB